MALIRKAFLAKSITYQKAQNIGGIIVLPVVGQVSDLFLIRIKIMLLLSKSGKASALFRFFLLLCQFSGILVQFF
ncbi:hypothetical protein NCCP28_29360 [Niallia sp. NCCP-28]|nr:hypothetical protein NCCP28_29360 [Niallia sp. NCCP-28]